MRYLVRLPDRTLTTRFDDLKTAKAAAQSALLSHRTARWAWVCLDSGYEWTGQAITVARKDDRGRITWVDPDNPPETP